MRKTHFPFLVGIQYSVVLAMLYVGYGPAQIPSNMVMPSLKSLQVLVHLT